MLLVLVLVRHSRRLLNWSRPAGLRLLKRRMLVRKQRVDSGALMPYSVLMGVGGPNFK
jgi:hypothetical protein